MEPENIKNDAEEDAGNPKTNPPREAPISPLPSQGTPLQGAKADIPTEQPEGSPSHPNEESPWERRHFQVTTLLQVLIIGITTYIAYIYLCQLKEMHATTQATIEATKDATDGLSENGKFNKIDERAWLFFKIQPVQFVAGKELSVAIDVVNIGKTPAKDVKCFTAYETLAGTMMVPNGTPLPKGTKPFEGPTFSQKADDAYLKALPSELVNPGDSLVVDVHVGQSLILDKNSIEDFQQGKRLVFVYGTVQYSDIFGTTHWQTFCKIYNPILSTFTEWVTHNDCDDN